ncbi:helix-turn-helix domain-containing protein [Pseudomonas sp. PDM30]|uniref:helix-turn-helix domain-containing protein n=1 Tax=Pseudomonas sp. PDM30 TaxID=2854773 RepID=UPI001C474A3E|nr:helix-turn-helix domain-containing protein [Pseudomonas sp. PDM30]MBV7489563.1 helix-turn-helix domain-containing protein [Pseudomonas sp. PDM30]
MSGTKQDNQNKLHLNENSLSAQRRSLLEWLRNRGPIDTLTARRDLNILMPASRIKELKNQGYIFHTQRITITDEHRRSHSNIAQYTLIGEPARRVAA